MNSIYFNPRNARSHTRLNLKEFIENATAGGEVPTDTKKGTP